ncbi:PAS domain S-box protein [Dasania marina]|uniref:PAS domain S-box protein n=1 Tax=Dasania marina TaxID=471499 RepID=UPI0030DCCC60|tara:strand:+ start:34223 stop:36571 length:2349 start_codon:yes stop_codon:yes gene_type:complete
MAIGNSVKQTTSDVFFHEQLAYLTALLNARHGFLTEIIDDQRLRTIAAWENGIRGPRVEYSPVGTPCEAVLRDGVQVIDGGLIERYSHIETIRDCGFESYVGSPIVDTQGQIIGHLCLYLDRRLEDPNAAGTIVTLVAERISAELEHRRQHKVLSQQRQLQGSLLTNLPGMVYRRANDHTQAMYFVSEGSATLTGHESKDLITGRILWADLIHRSDRHRVWDGVALALSAEENFEIQYRIVTESGQTKWVLDRGRGVTNDNGLLDAIEGFVTDITVLKKSESATARSDANFESFVGTAVDNIITIDVQGRVESFNKAAVDFFGYAENEIIGENVRQLMPEPYRSEHDGYLSRYLETGEAKIVGVGREVMARRKDGSIVPVHLSISEIELKGSRCFVGVLRDLTREKAAEEALRWDHERLNITLEHAPTGIVTYRFGERLISANRAFCELTGYAVDELIEMTVDDLTHPDDRLKGVALAAQARACNIEKFLVRKRYVRKDGTTIEVNVLNTSTHDVAGHLDIVIGQVEDLTPQLQAQAESREQREQLAHADRLNSLGEMTTGIAHEINQPLTAISLFAQAGKRLYEAGSHDRLPEIFDKLSQHAQRAGAIIERIQTMSRQQESKKEFADCNALVLDIAKLAEAEAGIRGISIEVEDDKNMLLVVVDTVQIQQVALNLLRNGMEAMRSNNYRNGNTIKIWTGYNNDGDIEVAVSDSGGGVSQRVAKNLFKPFSTTKQSGLGLGLSISRAIVVAHGGQLGFHNNEIGGATFSFTLPAATQGDQDE